MESRANDLSHEEIQQMVIRINPIIIEVGAHDGTDSLQFLNSFKLCRLFCFECEPRAIAKWRARVGARATLCEMAISDSVGETTFHQSGGSPRPGVTDWDHSGSIAQPTGHLKYSPWCTFDKTITVPTTTLDEWEKQHNFGYIDFIWMDIQGKDGPAMAASPNVLAKTRFVKLECHRAEMYAGQFNQDQMIQLFTEAGFICLGRFGDDLVFKNDRIAK